MSKYLTRHPTPPRRTLLLGGLTLALSACGFAPRGMIELPPVMRRVHLGGKQPDPAFAAALGRLLQQNGGELVSDAARASLRLTVTDHDTSRRQVVIDPRARLREVELTLRVVIKAEDAQGQILLAGESFEAARMMHYDPNNLLAASEDEARLRTDMYEIVAQSILARLRAAVAAKT
ncbi:MAG: LPS assembly lipoprotein LptE [Gammaproteobacteria bacterium]|nr:LPS assembly lipoprotein LptE [Gammaproteobacteria bacterium]